MSTLQAPPPPMQMMQMITGFWTSCCIYNAAKMNIAEILGESTQSIEALAEATHTNTDSLYRVMRALASVGIFEESDKRAFTNTTLSNTLKSNVPGSMKAMAIAQLGDHYDAWGNLLYTIKTGNTSFDKVEGMSVWKYYETHPDEGQNFAAAMAGLTMLAIKSVLPAYDFTNFKNIIDVGGGNGTFLMAILEATPGAKGIVFDEEYLQDESLALIERKGMSERCTVKSGSFFESVPSGADAYLMKLVLHDWNDKESLKILANCKKAMKPESKLLVFDSVIPEGNISHPGKFMDINMMAMTGGMERTEEEFASLFNAAGLKLNRVIPTHSPMLSILEVTIAK